MLKYNFLKCQYKGGGENLVLKGYDKHHMVYLENVKIYFQMKNDAFGPLVDDKVETKWNFQFQNVVI